jgi:PAS domain S-box-containing protein
MYFIRKRKDVPFNWIFICFGMFILACGAMHVMEIWNLWHADYWLSGGIKVITALASVATAILLVRLIPHALALPSPEAMRLEIAARKRAQEGLGKAKDELEIRVQERTAKLQKANDDLSDEILQRNFAEEALRRSEERFRLLVERVQDYAIFMLDTSGRVTTWNQGAEHINGYTAKEIIGLHFSQFYQAADIQLGKPETELQIAAAEGRFEEYGWRVRKDGSKLWANVIITALRNPRGELIGFSKITRDLTEQMRTEAALRGSEEQLRMASLTWPPGQIGTLKSLASSRTMSNTRGHPSFISSIQRIAPASNWLFSLPSSRTERWKWNIVSIARTVEPAGS